MVVVVLVTPVGTVTGVTSEETKVRRSVRIGKAMSINTVGSPGRWRQRHAWIGVSRETPPFHLAQVGSNCRIALATQPAKRLIDPDSSGPFQNHSHTPTNSSYVRGTNYAMTALSFTYGPRREPKYCNRHSHAIEFTISHHITVTVC